MGISIFYIPLSKLLSRLMLHSVSPFPHDMVLEQMADNKLGFGRLEQGSPPGADTSRLPCLEMHEYSRHPTGPCISYAVLI